MEEAVDDVPLGDGVLLFAHGWAHLVVWGLIPSLQPQSDSDPAHSWVLGDNRPVANGLAVLTMATFAVAAVGLAVHATWWGTATIAASVASLLLVGLLPAAVAGVWILVPIAINAALIVGVAWFDWPARAMF